MGVINTTPDSFSDGGSLYKSVGHGELASLDLNLCMQRASSMVEAGASILDIGGESTRPGAAPVPLQVEMDRVLPLLEKVAAELEVNISVDTSSPELMTAAASAGAWMINDVRALAREGAVESLAASTVKICLMHMQGDPQTMQANPSYGNVIDDVAQFLNARIGACAQAGIEESRIFLDPGFGFGKSLDHNLQLLNGLPRLSELGFPLIVGLSRKSLIDKILGRQVDQRLFASIGLAVLAAARGASIIRTHDVAETADAVAMVAALRAIKNN